MEVGSAESEQQRVVYIGGLGRSGSTLLELLLNSLPGFVAVGELRYIWEQGLQQNLLCACGQPFLECDFWSDVGTRAFGGWHQVDPNSMMRLVESVDRHRYLPMLLRPRGFPAFASRLREYQDILSRLYRAVTAVADAEIVIDSTKDPPFAFIVDSISSVDLRLVHLVRDSRGVAYSWMKQKRRPEVRHEDAWMNRYGAFSVSLRWLDYNVLFEMLSKRGTTSTTVRYEDLVRATQQVLTAITDQAEMPVPADTIRALIAGQVPVHRSHSVAGNPIRFDRKPLALSVDDEWQSRMRWRHRALVTSLTAPMLRRYGYVNRS